MSIKSITTTPGACSPWRMEKMSPATTGSAVHTVQYARDTQAVKRPLELAPPAPLTFRDAKWWTAQKCCGVAVLSIFVIVALSQVYVCLFPFI